MDLINQQFIAALHRTRRELMRLDERLALLSEALREQARAIQNSRVTNRGPESSPTVVAELLTPRPIEVETSPKNKNWGRDLVAILTLVFVAVYTVVTIYVFCETRRAARAAEDAANTAGKQEAAWEVSQRPWIEVANPGIAQAPVAAQAARFSAVQPFLQDEPYSFTAAIRNYGNTPALHVYTRLNPRFVALPHQIDVFLSNVTPPVLPDCLRSAPWERSDQAYFPTGPSNTAYSLYSNQQIASEHDMRELMRAREALYWVGCVRYQDAFNRRYQTNVCFYWSFTETPYQWNRCLTGNDLVEYPREGRGL